MSQMQNGAIVCPNDQSAYLFCRGMLQALKKRPGIQNVYLISDIFGEDTNGRYAGIVESWGFKHIPLKMARFIDPVDDIRYLYQLSEILRDNRICVVINVATKPNIYGPIAARLAGVDKVFCSVWGRGRIFARGEGFLGGFFRFCLSQMYRLAFSLSTRVWFTNRNDWAYFTDNRIVRRDRAFVTRNFVDVNDYTPSPLSTEKRSLLMEELRLTDEDKVVIMVARMLWAKGVREFVEASTLLRNRLPKAKFVMVGPKEKDSLDTVSQEYLDKHGKSDNFTWLGFRTDMKDLYSLSELAVLPSYYQEGGHPRGLLEPMSMGKPVIAADTVDCRSPVEHGRNGLLVPPKDSDALADAIEFLMKDEVKRMEFGAYSRKKAIAEYDEAVVVKQVFDAFFPGDADSVAIRS